MNIRPALAGWPLIFTHGCCLTLLKKLHPMRINYKWGSCSLPSCRKQLEVKLKHHSPMIQPFSSTFLSIFLLFLFQNFDSTATLSLNAAVVLKFSRQLCSLFLPELELPSPSSDWSRHFFKKRLSTVLDSRSDWSAGRVRMWDQVSVCFTRSGQSHKVTYQ